MRTALGLFAREGYEAVSVRDIAHALGVTPGALYRHFASKRAILDAIVESMREADAERARIYALPQGTPDEEGDAYRVARLDALGEYTMAQFLYWTGEGAAADFRRLLTVEQYRSAEMAQLYSAYLSGGPVGYIADIFAPMAQEGIIRTADPRAAATAFYSPVFLAMSLADNPGRRDETAAMVKSHITSFLSSLSAQ